MRIDGSCHCGKISYEADVDPGAVGLCHCTDCQKLSGSPYRASIATAAETFVMRGEPRLYIKTADSGQQRAQAFCPDCGSPLYSTSPDQPVIYNLRIGSIRQRAELSVRSQIWCTSALAWAQDISGVPARPQE